ncbi:MAG TPA: 50S ribosomal protein L11 methyltransferase [Acidimicrobiales bacterium]|nr:50S ribosomal protein L11 methyltransferase [Acidimicrobiales bacterium]
MCSASPRWRWAPPRRSGSTTIRRRWRRHGANAARNGVGDRFTVTASPLDRVVHAEAPFDLVTANLLLPDLLAVAPALRAALAAEGALVMSGILVEQRPPVIATASRLGLTQVGEETADGWLAATFAGSTGAQRPSG